MVAWAVVIAVALEAVWDVLVLVQEDVSINVGLLVALRVLVDVKMVVEACHGINSV